jgi:hypothetical protein
MMNEVRVIAVQAKGPLRVPGERRLSILAVGARQCRWPVADDPTVIGGILCCGAQTDTTYCSAHRALSAQPERQRSSVRGNHAITQHKAVADQTGAPIRAAA